MLSLSLLLSIVSLVLHLFCFLLLRLVLVLVVVLLLLFLVLVVLLLLAVHSSLHRLVAVDLVVCSILFGHSTVDRSGSSTCSARATNVSGYPGKNRDHMNNLIR